MRQFVGSEDVAALGLKRAGAGALLHGLASIVLPQHLEFGDHAGVDGFPDIGASWTIRVGSQVHIGISGEDGVGIADRPTPFQGLKIDSVSDD